ncbi:tail fiber protein [Yersinia kristensenii]|uniref:tail fiber protein n=1 Tax=Yersinia kristensenii TaxID=28152 RepID=UPI0022FF15DD|nr:tail fiber protein [Yersinia kristensenii]MDA5487619.1 tail fiber protein [Yersinia kristensenii]
MQKIGSIPNTRADSNGEFTDGNVAGGVPPTILPAEWFNTIQRELINILAAAGITPDSKKFDQVAKAISTLVDKGEFLPIKGTAVAATKLATPRTIAGKSFDGTANIAIGAADVGALPLTGGVLSGPLTINGMHNEYLGPNGFKTCLVTPATGGITNPGGAGIGFHSDQNIYLWNSNTGYAMTLSPTSLSVNRPINISNVVGAAFSIKSKNESDVCYIMSVSDTPTKSKWYMGNTKENDTTLHIVNSKTSTILSIGDTISSSAPFLAPKITPSDYSNFDERYEPALIGTPMPWPLTTAPAGYLKCNGASFNKTQYPKLALAYPSGVLPDLRGEFIRGFDDGRGVRPNQPLLGWQGSEIQSHNHGITNFEIRGVTGGPTNAWFPSTNGISTNNSGGDETRPRNIAFNYIVRAL